MNFINHSNYKALTSFRWDNIAPLAIITGLNGVGKTQLIDLLVSASHSTVNSSSNLQCNFENFATTYRKIGVYGSSNGFHFNEPQFSYDVLEHLVNSIYKVHEGKEKGVHFDIFQPNSFPNNFNEEKRNITSRFLYVIQNKIAEIWNYILSNSGKLSSNIDREDIILHFPVSIFLEDKDVMRNDGTDLLFYMYQYKKIEGIRSGKSAVDFGPAPWEILNEVISEANLPYRITHPDEEEIVKIFRNPINKIESKIFKVSLVNPITNEEIGFQNLSSGEKVLMSLALMLYSSQQEGGAKDLILLDEPDAHLHPSMTKKFFDVIYNVLIKNHGARVIMTTHSASTIALAPETDDCVIYELKKNPSQIVVVDSRAESIKLLTEGLIIVTPSTKYVLIEGKDDKPFYETVYRKLLTNGYISKDTSLAFVKGTGKGSVNHWSDSLSDVGLGDLVRGIIDKDNGNPASNGIFVLERYSIENYLLDPMLVFSVGNKLPSSVPTFGILSGEDERIIKLSQDKMQQIVNAMLNYIQEPLFPTIQDQVIETIKVNYINGYQIEYPSWFLNTRFKDQLQLFRQSFGSNLTYPLLCQAISRTGLIPTDLLKLLIDVQA